MLVYHDNIRAHWKEKPENDIQNRQEMFACGIHHSYVISLLEQTCCAVRSLGIMDWTSDVVIVGLRVVEV